MALPIGARPASVPGYTEVIMDDDDNLFVNDPDGAVLQDVQNSLGFKGSPAEMRGSGALGADTRTAGPGGLWTPREGQSVNPGIRIDTPSSPTATPGGFPSIRRAEEGRHAAEVGGGRGTVTPEPVTPAAPAPALDPVADAAAQVNAQAQAQQPMGVLIPGQKGGFVETSRTTQTQGPDQASQKRLQVLFANAANWTEEDVREVTEITNKLTAQYQAAKQDQIARKRGEEQGARIELDREKQAQTKASQDVQDAQQIEINPSRLWGDPWFAVSAAIGGIAAAILDLRNGTKTADMLWKNLNDTLARDLVRQRETKSGALEAAKQRLGDATGEVARLTVEARQAKDVADELQRAHDEAPIEAQAKLIPFIQQARARQRDLQAEAVKAQTSNVATSSTSQNTPSTPDMVIPIPKAEMIANNIDPKKYEEVLNSKIDPGMQNAPSVANAISGLTQMDEDIALLEALKPGQVVTRNMWDSLSQGAQRAAASIGIDTSGKTAVTANQLEQLDNIVTNKIAKGYGGAITDADRDSASKEYGKTKEAKSTYLRRIRKEARNRVVNALNASFPGQEDTVLSIRQRSLQNARGLQPTQGKRVGSVE
jgi:hypothetical protein